MNSRTLTALAGLAAAILLRAQDAPYSKMAPVGEYLMERNAEVALARSAAPDSISGDAEVLVLGPRGYEVAVKGKNGFVCIVQRSWTSGIDDPEFWNPKLRAPFCYNPAGARSYLPVTIRKTEWVMAGKSKAQIFDGLKAAFAKGELPALEPGSMAFMMSKQGYLNDRDGHWQPHLMLFSPPADAASWGAGLPGSPILAFTEAADRVTVFLVPVTKWSDGTAASHM